MRVTQKYLDSIMANPKIEHITELVPMLERQRAELVARCDSISELEAQNQQQRELIISLRARVGELEASVARNFKV